MRKFEEIQEEIKKLRELKPGLRNINHFGESIHAAVDAQISVLENSMDEDAVDEAYADDEDNVYSAARDAVDWRNEEHETDSLAEDWKPLKL